jgi:hypothetical protein
MQLGYKKILVVVVVTLTVFIRCSPPKFHNDLRQQNASATDYFSDSTTNFEIAVHYEEGAEPYTGDLGNGLPTWDITRQSYAALFKTHINRTLTIPQTVQEMNQFPRQNIAKWTERELSRVAMSVIRPPGPNQRVVSVIFVHGTYEGDSHILGVSFSGYRYTFIFKDVVVSVGGDPVFQKYVEQATVVHEVGHVIGLVNNGLPQYRKHEDPEHPNHSSDPNDVMYWHFTSPEEISTSAKAFSLRTKEMPLNLKQDLNLFGPASLADGHHFHSP